MAPIERMLDFLIIRKSQRNANVGGRRIPVYDVCPDFDTIDHADIMIRGGEFYAYYDKTTGLWSTNQSELFKLIDSELAKFKKENFSEDDTVFVAWMRYSSTGSVAKFHKYCEHDLSDDYKQLDSKIIFSDQEVTRDDYCTRKLDYSLCEGARNAYERLIGTLLNVDDRRKYEYAVGSLIAGDAPDIQKFYVLYGSPGTGKGTALYILEELFGHHVSPCNVRELTSGAGFPLEAFRDNPLVAIDPDGDLSRVADNTKLNSIVSHETILMNVKHLSQYPQRFNSTLFVATNRPVKITDAKSGLLRRLIDIFPSGRKVPPKEYSVLKSQIKFEKGAIAKHCLDVYKELGPDYYDAYVPTMMMQATNDFYDFIDYNYDYFENSKIVTLREAYMRYQKYCDELRLSDKSQMKRNAFSVELKNYFKRYEEELWIDGKHYRRVYLDFDISKFGGYDMRDIPDKPAPEEKAYDGWIEFNCTESLFDKYAADIPAQYAKESDGTPQTFWSNVKTKLSDILTTKLHYVNLPPNHIVIDFDLKDEEGNKSLERNLEAANKFPQTYAEISKSGSGIHLHYIYTGDPSRLCLRYDPSIKDIEIKVFTGDAALRRKLTRCNDIPIATISSGLPIKGESKVTNLREIKSEAELVRRIEKALNKGYEPGSTASMTALIYTMLESMYNADPPIHYDVEYLSKDIRTFASRSSHQPGQCLDIVDKMHFKSRDEYEYEPAPDSIIRSNEGPENPELITIFDIEVFKNLLVIVWKYLGPNHNCVVMMNPTPHEVYEFVSKHPYLVGYNCRDYDNHILHARIIGKSLYGCWETSDNIINGDGSEKSRMAYDYSWTDIFDYASKKQSLKKWEYELARKFSKNHPNEPNPYRHQELGIPWDEPAPEELWDTIVEYCKNDVITTEAVFHETAADFKARQILADLSGGTVNDKTNTLTKRLIFGKDRNPQRQFRYRNLAEPVLEVDQELKDFLNLGDEPEFVAYNGEKSFLPFFPGYEFVFLKDEETNKVKRYSLYRGMKVGEGGLAWSRPGYYENVWVFDIASQHPSSAEDEMLFGPVYTERFRMIKNIRICIKHGEYDKAIAMMPELAKWLTDKSIADNLATALKIAINSVYGLTSAKFPNEFKDPRNEDNIVAKRGELFMIDLLFECEARGYSAIHVKTDSIKIVDPSEECKQFIFEFGKKYGYTFEIEHVFSKFCIVNKSVYIAKMSEDDPKHPGEWNATGKQFQVPYIFKKLFADEGITLDDVCETFSVSGAGLYLDMNESLPENEHKYVFVGRIGQFTPVVAGAGGGLLLRSPDNGKTFAFPGGAKGYRWLETTDILKLDKADQIDYSYYDAQAEAAIKAISQYVDFDIFVGNKQEDFSQYINVPEDAPEEGLPFN